MPPAFVLHKALKFDRDQDECFFFFLGFRDLYAKGTLRKSVGLADWEDNGVGTVLPKTVGCRVPWHG